MNFERGNNPLKTMDVGMEAKALVISSCALKFKINKEEGTNTKAVDSADIGEVLEMWQNDFFPFKRMLTILALRGFFKFFTAVRVQEIHFKLIHDPEYKEFPLGGDRAMLERGSGDSLVISWQGKIYELKCGKHYKYFLI